MTTVTARPTRAEARAARRRDGAGQHLARIVRALEGVRGELYDFLAEYGDADLPGQDLHLEDIRALAWNLHIGLDLVGGGLNVKYLRGG